MEAMERFGKMRIWIGLFLYVSLATVVLAKSAVVIQEQ